MHAVDGDGEVQPRSEEVAVAAARSRPWAGRRSGPRVSAATAALSYSAPDEDGSVKTVGRRRAADDEYAGIGRNAPCPCGSGKKFKLCHGRAGGY